MAQSKKASNELRNTLLKSGAVIPSSDNPAHFRSFDKAESQANAIASRRKELNKVPAILQKSKE